MKPTLTAALAATTLAVVMHVPSSADEPRREAPPHVHGVGQLDVAVDVDMIMIELAAPANDIVGFEHAPASDAEKKAVAEARARLLNGGGLFQFTPAAKCALKKAKVELEGALEEGKKHESDKHDHASHDHAKDEAGHSEFHASYSFQCQSPMALSGMKTAFFSTFKNAMKLKVTMLGPKGQGAGEASRVNPEIDLASVL
ncbi:MAG: DUF2796 domain-containing protein [Hyphomicrobiaceae bacterium]